MSEPPELLRFRDVDKTFGRVRTLAGFNFAVGEAEFVALTGPPGGGKATILHLAAGLELPGRGAVTIAGIDTRRRPRALYDAVGLVFGDADIGPDKSVGAALGDVGRLHGLTDAWVGSRAEGLIDRFGLGDHERDRMRALRPLDKRRMRLAAAVLHRPRLLLLQDITRGLDQLAAGQIVADISRLCVDEGLAVLMGIEQADLAAAATRMVVMNHGSIVFDGTPTALLDHSGSATLSTAINELIGETA